MINGNYLHKNTLIIQYQAFMSTRMPWSLQFGNIIQILTGAEDNIEK